jgi:23S rRNA (cytosine1962-C5)-methyltransferase
MFPENHFLASPSWKDYELLDSGSGQKLERFGPYTFVRPEVQALWKPALPPARWDSAHALFMPTGEESGGHWVNRRQLPEKWEMSYGALRFFAMTTHGRHLGVFPECAAQWDWMTECISHLKLKSSSEINILNLFGYTGLASLACALHGARVTHVDASKKSVAWARENQVLSGLENRPIRWIVDDALKFVEREQRRGMKYDAILLDPPKFGRGPKGEVWEVFKSLPVLLAACRQVLNSHPLFVVLTVYAVKLPAVHLYTAMGEMMAGLSGSLECGELVTVEKSAGRLLSQAVFARWGNL